ncbi:hypothetical protein [Anaerotruncus colihominis]|mgnify:FL=1|uniref:Uncharacterized protein n=1 Tax=Anaerotruncus colihominis TaxID=169435 RepID=A0A174PH75_9FIRM|nr:hypothetical protein [Anaerotruncus colihominis]MBS4988680.1 hypothetical protein [Anaerotruncus colihominis]MCQ4733495.1 hypothetical protein [Anaerotruncus colihominis]RGE69911.1 hypothetical protein DXC40_02295 [Anaerotruncus colihominis]CUP57755.1 Uncharacterised protein [Anaerotruncus colihominis]
MYRILAILAALSIALCFCLPVAAASYQDDCMDVLNDHIREYNGFSRNISDFIVFSGWSGCGDRSVITVDSREASATYRIDGARRVQIQLFSSQSTIAVPSNDYYRMSVRSDEELGQARRCYYDRSKDVVFIQENGRNYSLCNERRGLMLREDDSALRKDCYYGLNVFVSTDGVSYQTVNDVRLDKIESQNLEEGTGVFVRETYSAGLPSSAAYVRLVFIECAKIPGRGAADIIDRSNLHFLSKITFEGGALEPGGSSEPESSSSEPESGSSEPESSSSEPESSSSEPDSSQSSSLASSSGSPESSSSAPVNSSEPENGVSEPEDILPGATGGSTGKAPSGRRISNKPSLTASPPKTADVWYSGSASLEQPNEQASLAGGYEAAQTDRMPFSDFSSGDDMGITVHHNFSEGSSGRAPIPERTLYHGSVGGAGAALVIAGALKNLRR